MFNITVDEPHYNSMDSIMSMCRGWTHSSLLKSVGRNEFFTTWMYEFRDDKDKFYIQIKKELDTGLIEVVYAEEGGEQTYPFFSTFYVPEDAVNYVARILLHLIIHDHIKVNEMTQDMLYRRTRL